MLDRFPEIKPLARWLHRPPVIPVLRLTGAIGEAGRFTRGMSLASLAEPIHRAFAMARAPAVALAINSPGGTPVQAALIAQRIRDLAQEKDKTVYAFVEDVAASGGYWLACAADEIYADPSSIVGSIGVVAAGFGLEGFIQRHGIERRVYTAGRRKVILDPFAPVRDDDIAKIRAIQDDIHGTFKALVRERRAGRLKAEDSALFDGEFWTGTAALDLGLIDGLGHLRPVLRAKYGDKVRLRVVTPARGWLRRRIGLMGGDRLGDAAPAGLIEGLLAAVEERALWQRFGL